jgi:hypothetical protein
MRRMARLLVERRSEAFASRYHARRIGAAASSPSSRRFKPKGMAFETA